MSKIDSPSFLFLAAKEFFENGTLYAAKHFKIKKEAQLDLSDSIIHSKLCVPATNIAFSLELAFKAFLKQSGIRAKGHDLINLFGLLNADTKSQLIEHYNSHDTYQDYIVVRITNNGGEHGKLYK